MNKYALVTGSSDRIGKAMAIELAKQGYRLLLHYNNSIQKATQVKTEVTSFGVEAELIHINFLEENNFDDIFLQLKNRHIQLEVLLNCAADFIPSDFTNNGNELLQKEIKINFEKAYLLTKAFAHVFEQGLIVNFLDTKVEKNYTKHLDYILSKKLLKEFTKLSAVHLAPNFRVNAIAPGLILPPKDKDETYLLNLAKNIPLQTIGNVEEIAKALRFLLESKFVTGQILYIDGGEHLV
ncbi:MAG: SDR family oxidoreductase [Chitinophagaceae bacterium]|nr:SDR family oxidoreductase [Chitinophagaceae bacterium]MCW5905989.1 SDR family oxidoreductase [Chitinophagaceae bacterium]